MHSWQHQTNKLEAKHSRLSSGTSNVRASRRQRCRINSSSCVTVCHTPMKEVTSATGKRNSLPDSAKLRATSTKPQTDRQITRNHHCWLAAYSA